MAQSIVSERSIEHYISEINRYPLLSRQAERELAEAHRDRGDAQAAHKLVVSNLRFVVKIAHEYRGYGLKLLDLVQEGNVGLMLAVKKFEPSRGYRLISYAVWWVRAYIQNFIMKSWSQVKVGTTQAQRKLFFKLRGERARAERALGGGQTVSAAELAARLDVREHEVVEMSQRMGGRDMSLDQPVDPSGRQTHLDMLAEPSDVLDPSEQVAESQAAHQLRQKIQDALRHLNEKERFIATHRLMADEPKTLQAIGHHFSISRERARQIEGNVMRKIKHALGARTAALGAA
jgi:RNA polymerase sigma-32 factor